MNREVARFFRKHADLHKGFRARRAPSGGRAAVIVEARDCTMLFEVILEHLVKLGPGWNLHVFCTEANHGALRNATAGWDVTFHLLGGWRTMRPEHFSMLCKSEAFWEAIPEEEVLMFQYDSVLFRALPDSIRRFEFVGAPCGRDTLNGGLSYRRKSAMLRCIRANAARIRADPHEAEDVFFTDCLRADPAAKPLPTREQAAAYFVESHENPRAVGAHGTDKPYMPRGTLSWTAMLAPLKY